MVESYAFQGLIVMFEWNEKTIEWFSSSASETTFHKKIAEKIIPHLESEKSLLSLGSGLGFLERYLSPYIKNMTLVDNNPSAVDYLKANKLANQTVINSCWQEVDTVSDYLLLSFFSRMYVNDTLDSLLKLTKKKIFYIINERRSEMDNVIGYLDGKGVSYSVEKMRLNFNQVLLKAEIPLYMDTYYSNANENRKNKILSKMESIDKTHVVYKNDKKIALFIIHKE